MAVLVVTVASQARNTKQQQIDDQAAIAVSDQRFPRFINSSGVRQQLNESVILTVLKTMRAVNPVLTNETTATSVSLGY